MNTTTKLFGTLTLALALLSVACGSKAATDAPTGGATKTAAAESKSGATGAASAVVKEIYGHALKRDCAAIPPLLTEEFRKAVGSSKDELDALCDTFTESGKITAFDVKSEEAKGDAATVKVILTFKDGKTQDKEERMKKAGDKWLMDS